ncbi:MAG: helix-turn-helix domain-containing protein [Bacteroides sp.]|nr:helix-turn-helix domain-containing protein [Bacteroides sp.]
MNDIDIKKIRETLGVSQEKLAGMLGVHSRTIQNWEAGAVIPHSKHAILRSLVTQYKAQQYYGGEYETPVHDTPRDTAPTTERLLGLLEAKEQSLAKAQEQIDRLLSIIEKFQK